MAQDEIFDLNPPVQITFLAQCEHRVFNSKMLPFCKYRSMAAGERVGTTPELCAQCQSDGSVNEGFLHRLIVSLLRVRLNHFSLGFYVKDLKYSEELLLRCYKYMVDAKDKTELLSVLYSVSDRGKYPSDWVVRLLHEKMSDLLREGPREITKPDVSPVKDEPIDFSNFKCCGGKRLGNKGIFLTNTDGSEIEVMLGRVIKMTEAKFPDFPSAKSLLMLRGGGTLVVNESNDEVRQVLQDLSTDAEEPETTIGVAMKRNSNMPDVAKMIYGGLVDNLARIKREAGCRGCDVVDPDGNKLFREASLFGKEIYYCGIPYWKKVRRKSVSPEVWGCGCILNVKWWGKTQACPLVKKKW